MGSFHCIIQPYKLSTFIAHWLCTNRRQETLWLIWEVWEIFSYFWRRYPWSSIDFEGTASFQKVASQTRLKWYKHIGTCSGFKGCYEQPQHVVLKQAIIHHHHDGFHRRCVALNQTTRGIMFSSGWCYEVDWMHINVDGFVLVFFFKRYMLNAISACLHTSSFNSISPCFQLGWFWLNTLSAQ